MVLEEFKSQDAVCEFVKSVFVVQEWPHIKQDEVTYTIWGDDEPDIGFLPELIEGRRQLVDKIELGHYKFLAKASRVVDAVRLTADVYRDLMTSIAETPGYVPVFMVTRQTYEGIKATYLFKESL